jgi:membrane-associated phospholipid phosphatase
MLCGQKSQGKVCHFFKDYAIFLGFVILALIIWLAKLNQPLFYSINKLHIIMPTIAWQTLNFISYPKLFILPLLLLVITFVWRKQRLKQVIILIIAYYLVFEVLKIVVGEARPYMVLPQDSFFWINKFENATKNAYKSFPSGHTGNMAIFVFAICAMFNRRWLKILLFILLLLAGLSRISTGWHWPLDVISSGLIAYVLVQLCLCRKNVIPVQTGIHK